MVYNNDGRVHAGYVATNGEVIKLAAAICDQYGRIAQRDSDGRFLLNHGETFSLLLSNYHSTRKASMRITGDSESTVIATSLILSPDQIDGRLERWQTVDQSFVAYRRESAEGDMVGGQSVAEQGGGLISVTFTMGEMPYLDSGWQSMGMRGGGYATRSGGFEETTRSFSRGASKGATPFDEGVMGAGGQSGQRFGNTSFTADHELATVEIQLRWVIRRPQAPLDRRVVVNAPTL
jgi:hypothetical protein